MAETASVLPAIYTSNTLALSIESLSYVQLVYFFRVNPGKTSSKKHYQISVY